MLLELNSSSSVSKIRDQPTFYLLIDALDEIPSNEDKKEIFAFLDSLFTSRNPSLHLLATSRDHHDIASGLASWSKYAIDGDIVVEDIRLFVNNTLQSASGLSSQKETLKDEILKRLVDNGNGM
jgi:hypothetical protein